jgi:hypothetical protein
MHKPKDEDSGIELESPGMTSLLGKFQGCFNILSPIPSIVKISMIHYGHICIENQSVDQRFKMSKGNFSNYNGVVVGLSVFYIFVFKTHLTVCDIVRFVKSL